jgi:hypothetical protein
MTDLKFLEDLYKLLGTGQVQKVRDALDKQIKKCKKDGGVTTNSGGVPPQQPPPDPTQPDG